jgi:lipase chaperone LimK
MELHLQYPDGKTYDYNFNGIQTSVLTRLAMIGAAGLLSKRKDPKKSWGLIQQGIFGRDTRTRRYTLIVRAIAGYRDVSLDDAQAQWGSLKSTEKKKLTGSLIMKRQVAIAKANMIMDGGNNKQEAQQVRDILL